jgi:alpha-galactosidase
MAALARVDFMSKIWPAVLAAALVSPAAQAAAAKFDRLADHGDWKSFGVLQILDMQGGLRAHAGTGHWNDPDMLEVGNGMPLAEERAHFSAWAMLAALRDASRTASNSGSSPWKAQTGALMVLNRDTKPRAVSFDWSAESVRDELSRRDAGFVRCWCCA